QLADASALETQFAIIRSDSLLQRVVIKERLIAAPPAQEQNPSQGASQQEAKSTEAQRVQDAVNGLRGALAVGRTGQSYVPNIAIPWADPHKAAQLANAVADAYVLDQLDARFEAAKRASAWLSDRLVDLRQQVRTSEEAVLKFRSENGFAGSAPNVTLNE